jgi:hypothetical protein
MMIGKENRGIQKFLCIYNNSTFVDKNSSAAIIVHEKKCFGLIVDIESVAFSDDDVPKGAVFLVHLFFDAFAGQLKNQYLLLRH